MIVTGWIAAMCVALGAAGVLISAIGLLRFPDFYTRVHAVRLAGAIGAPLLIIGVGLSAIETALALKLAILAILIFMLGPAAAHMLSSAAHGAGLAPFTPRDRAKRSR